MKNYFSHDFNARNDPKLLKLRQAFGVAGIGIYWSLIEILFEQNGYIKDDEISSIAFDLRVEDETILNILKNFNLFTKKNKMYFSNGVLKRIEIVKEKSKVLSDNAKKRWELSQNYDTQNKYISNANAMQMHSKCIANAMQTECKSNAIKRNKNILNNIDVDSYSLDNNNITHAHESETTTTNLTPLLSLCKDLVIDCEFDFTKYDLDLLVEKIKDSRYLKLFRSLKEILFKYDKIINGYYADFKIQEKIKVTNPKDAKHRTYTKEQLDDLYDDINQVII